ncbi:MAG: tripartite tricarboxylate transporter TctB family protein [Oscillospiraceae bacterium]
MKQKQNRVTGVILIAIGVWFAAMTMQIVSRYSMGNDPGSKIFPLIACIGLVGCGIALIFSRKETKGEAFLTKDGIRRFLGLFAVILAYFAGLYYVGFRIATPPMLFITAMMFGKEKKVKPLSCAIFALLATALIYIVFYMLLSVSLPRGKLF